MMGGGGESAVGGHILRHDQTECLQGGLRGIYLTELDMNRDHNWWIGASPEVLVPSGPTVAKGIGVGCESGVPDLPDSFDRPLGVPVNQGLNPLKYGWMSDAAGQRCAGGIWPTRDGGFRQEKSTAGTCRVSCPGTTICRRGRRRVMEQEEVSKIEKPAATKLRQPTPERFYSDVGQVTAGLLKALGVTLGQVKTMDYVERPGIWLSVQDSWQACWIN